MGAGFLAPDHIAELALIEISRQQRAAMEWKDLDMQADTRKSRDPAHMGGRVRYDAVVLGSDGRMVFSIGFYRGKGAKARALAKAHECIARKLETGDFVARVKRA